MSKQEVRTCIFIPTKQGKISKIPIDDIPLSHLIDKNGKQKTRKPTGVKVISLRENDEVVGIAIHTDLIAQE